MEDNSLIQDSRLIPSSTAFGILHLFDLGHSIQYAAASHWGFNVYFPDESPCQTRIFLGREGGSIVTRRVKLLPAVPTSHMATDWFKAWLIYFQSSLLLMLWESSSRSPKCIGSCVNVADVGEVLDFWFSNKSFKIKNFRVILSYYNLNITTFWLS